MKLLCGDAEIIPRLDAVSNHSMLAIGNSRSGKTFAMMHLAANLIRKGYRVQAIDIGDKWSRTDKNVLINCGAGSYFVDKETVTFRFGSIKEMTGIAKCIADALGYQSYKAVAAVSSSISALAAKSRNSFLLKELIQAMKTEESEVPEVREWINKIGFLLDSLGETPYICFTICSDRDFFSGSFIWDLSGLDDTFVRMMTYLLMYCLYCKHKRGFRNGDTVQREYLLLDEFQTLNCTRKSILGTCLTEGAKIKVLRILSYCAFCIVYRASGR